MHKRRPIRALNGGEFPELVPVRNKKSQALDELPLDKEPTQSHRDKRPEECWDLMHWLYSASSSGLQHGEAEFSWFSRDA